MINGEESFWLKHERDAFLKRDSLQAGNHEFDVVVVGGGLSGLWATYWLLQNNPALSVAVLEAEQVGHGGSGRNGGWLSTKMVGLEKEYLKSPHGSPQSVKELQRLIRSAIPEILKIFAENNIEIDAANHGAYTLAHSPSEAARLRAHIAAEEKSGVNDNAIFLTKKEIKEKFNLRNITAGAYNSEGAIVNPAKMILGLASLVELMGAKVFENSRVKNLQPRLVSTKDANVKAKVIINATEGYGQGLGDNKRWLTPIMSSMLITEPLPEEYWSNVGWTQRWGINGAGHRYFYSQRTKDNRLAFGGRGLPYKYGSRLDNYGKVSDWTTKQLTTLMHNSLDVSPDARIEQSWCGMLGVPRDWTPSISYDKETGLGVVGGFVGQGLPATFVAGQTLADLVAGVESTHAKLPWVNRVRKQWEPEPLRFLGAYGVYTLYQMGDTLEHLTKTKNTSIFAKLADFVGGR